MIQCPFDAATLASVASCNRRFIAMAGRVLARGASSSMNHGPDAFTMILGPFTL
jgi:hypothetical protein